MGSPKAVIAAISSYLPVGALTNEQLATEFGGDWNADKIYRKTGILKRTITGFNECSSDLAVNAANRLFADHNINPATIDFIILCTQTPDYFLPTTACLLQHRLGLQKSCGALDINQGCTGYVYGLSIVKGLIESNSAKCVLFLTAETYSKLIDPNDRSTRTIFGDAATATLIVSKNTEQNAIGPFVFGTDGSGSCHLNVESGAFRDISTQSRDENHQNRNSNVRLAMNGPEIFSFTLRVVPSMIDTLLSTAKLKLADIDHFVFHQANKFMLDHLREKLAIPEEKFCYCLSETGNTVSSSIPITMESYINMKKFERDQRIMLVSFGVGLSWAATIIHLNSPLKLQ
jgi:3-oxoacyl-[acyl-carrier-protein] synthase-3